MLHQPGVRHSENRRLRAPRASLVAATLTLAALSLTATAARAIVVYTDPPDAGESQKPTLQMGGVMPFQMRDPLGASAPYTINIAGIANEGSVGAANGSPALPEGAPINASLDWADSRSLYAYGLLCRTSPWTPPFKICTEMDGGPWADGGDHYAALRFRDTDGIHYGWARIQGAAASSEPKQTHVTLEDYAYESVPDRPIMTGRAGSTWMGLAPAMGITDVGATINGTVSPAGQDATGYFEWGETAEYGHATPARTISGSEDVVLREPLTGLAPLTTYHYRLTVVNSDGTAHTNDATFTTGGPVTGAATNLTMSSATLNGAAPPSSAASLFFEWGADTAYGNSVPARRTSGDGVQTSLSGLAPGATYHYRLTAVYPGGAVARGADASFATLLHPYCVNQAATGPTQDGRSWATAFRTINQAIQADAEHLEIWVAAGTYNEQINCGQIALYGGFKGTEEERSLRNPSVNETVLDGDHAGLVVLLSGRDARLDGFTVRNGYSSSDAGGVHIFDGATLANSTVTGNTGHLGGVALSNASLIQSVVSANTAIPDSSGARAAGGVSAYGRCVVDSNAIHGNTSGGINLWKDARTVIANTTVFGNTAQRGGGVFVDAGGQVVILNCTIAGNTAPGGGGGICLSGGSGSVFNTIVAFNSSGMDKNAADALTSKNNDVYGNTAYDRGFGPDPTGTGGNISEDPLFVNAAMGDYHLSPGSPCIDAGDDSYFAAGDTDEEGRPRILGAHADMGACEFAPPAAFSMADAVHALRLAGGMDAFGADDSRLDIIADGASSGVVDITDAIRITREAAGPEPNP